MFLLSLEGFLLLRSQVYKRNEDNNSVKENLG